MPLGGSCVFFQAMQIWSCFFNLGPDLESKTVVFRLVLVLHTQSWSCSTRQSLGLAARPRLQGQGRLCTSLALSLSLIGNYQSSSILKENQCLLRNKNKQKPNFIILLSLLEAVLPRFPTSHWRTRVLFDLPTED